MKGKYLLVIQDPTDEQGTFLLESLLETFTGAHRVAGAFAFVSAAGVRLLTTNPVFQDIARQKQVDLVVGIDAVTNLRALDSLQAVRGPNVRIRAFLNPRPQTIFHPKFCWTRGSSGGWCLVGSGNLTEGGLLGNWEAYSIDRLGFEAITAVETAWNVWVEAHEANLHPLDHPEVRSRAAANHVLAPEGDLPVLAAHPAVGALVEEPVATQLAVPTSPVLIAEIPRSGNRWNQVNFHLDDYVNFFGAVLGTTRLMVFRHVNSYGSLADFESERPSVAVSSQNYRFELAAAAGLAYPMAGRPIGVYIRVAVRTFYYHLLMPGDEEHQAVSALLQQPASTQMRTRTMTVSALQEAWPTAPFWLVNPTS